MFSLHHFPYFRIAHFFAKNNCCFCWQAEFSSFFLFSKKIHAYLPYKSSILSLKKLSLFVLHFSNIVLRALPFYSSVSAFFFHEIFFESPTGLEYGENYMVMTYFFVRIYRKMHNSQVQAHHRHILLPTLKRRLPFSSGIQSNLFVTLSCKRLEHRRFDKVSVSRSTRTAGTIRLVPRSPEESFLPYRRP